MSMNDWLNMYPPDDKDLLGDKFAAEDKSGTPPISKKKLLKKPSQKSLDLHGCTAEESRTAVEHFLKASKQQGYKKVLIIHGKGYHSTGKPVLKNEVIKLLERNPLAGQFGTADRKEGGSGAVWVLIK